jgi:SAM-dependent methyltransferase
MSEIETALGIPELRGVFLEYADAAFAALPRMAKRRVLDLGCGSGVTLLHLARTTDAVLTGLDPDATAIASLRREVEREGLANRVETRVGSVLDTGHEGASFDVLWEEGMLHLVPLEAALAECRRLLSPGGHLVSCETLAWHETSREAFARAGFAETARVPWRPGCWWADYYAPLAERIERAKAERGPSAALRRYEDEVAAVRADPARFDCAHVVHRRSP